MTTKRLRLRGDDHDRAARLMAKWGLRTPGEVARAAMRACELLSIMPFAIVDPTGYQVDPTGYQKPDLPSESESSSSFSLRDSLLPLERSVVPLSKYCRASDEKTPPPPKPNRRKPRTQISDYFPSEFELAKARAFWAEKNRPDLDAQGQAEQFHDHHLKTGGVAADWPAAWRYWYRNALSMTKEPRNDRRPNAHEKFLAGGLAALAEFRANRGSG